MGYETYFEGGLTITPPLNEDETKFLIDFSESRRMQRTRGPLYVGGGQDFRGEDVLTGNSPDPAQPGLHCPWAPSDDGTTLMMPEEAGKYYMAAEWLTYLMDFLLNGTAAQDYVDEHFMEDSRLLSFTFDHKLNGIVEAQGEEASDKWRMVVENGKLKLQEAQFTWVDAR